MRPHPHAIAATVFTPASALVGESPVWDANARRLWWTDLAGGELHGTELDGHPALKRSLGSLLGAVVLREDGGLTAVLDAGVSAFQDDRLTRIADVSLPGPSHRVNDAKCDPLGRLWVGVVGTEPERAPGSLHLLRGHRTHPVLDGLAFPNGFDWSPDGTIMYLAESDARRVVKFEFDPGSDGLEAAGTLVELPDDDGLPDGVAVDEGGGVWVAIWGAGEVRRYSPVGDLTMRVVCPVSQVTSCAFGGPDWRTLCVTSAREGLSDADLGAEQLAGSVFHARVPFRGLTPRKHRPREAPLVVGGLYGARQRMLGFG